MISSWLERCDVRSQRAVYDEIRTEYLAFRLTGKGVRNFFVRLTAILTITAFIATSIPVGSAWAVQSVAELPHVGSDDASGSGFSPDIITKSGALKELNVDTFSLPHYLGAIRNRGKVDPERTVIHPSTNAQDELPQKTVIHLQDAHCNYAAQTKISEIIEYLTRTYDVDTINLEGGAGDYNFSIFNNIPDKSIRLKVSDDFVKEGLVSGAEYFAINNQDKVKLWGIEDVGLYMENLNVYRSSLAHKEEIDKDLKTLDHILNNLKRRIYTDELFELDLKYVLYKTGAVEFKDYLNYILQRAKDKLIDIRLFTNVYILYQSLEQERLIDFRRANNERETLIDAMQKRLSKRELEELVLKTLEFKAERVSQEEFYAYIMKKAKSLNLRIGDYPELQKYILYISMYDAVDKLKVMQELDTIESKIKEVMFKNDTQRRLNVLSKNLALLKNIFNVSLTREDYKYYCENESSFAMSNYIAFVKREAPIYKITATLSDDIAMIDQYRDDISKFYECSLKRDQAFLKNIRFAKDNLRTTDDGRRTTILVTGGFHTDNLCELFKSAGISYVSVMPNFRNDEGYESPYFQLLAGELTGIQKRIYAAVTTLMPTSTLAIASFINDAIQKGGLPVDEVTRRKAFTEAFAAWDAARNDARAGKPVNGVLLTWSGSDKEPLGLDLEANTPKDKITLADAESKGFRVVDLGETKPVAAAIPATAMQEELCKFLQMSPTDLRKNINLFLGDAPNNTQIISVTQASSEGRPIYRVVVSDGGEYERTVYVRYTEKRELANTQRREPGTVLDTRWGSMTGVALLKALNAGDYGVKEITGFSDDGSSDGMVRGVISENAGVPMIQTSVDIPFAGQYFISIADLLKKPGISRETRVALIELLKRIAAQYGRVVASHYVLGYTDGNAGNICLKLTANKRELNPQDLANLINEPNAVGSINAIEAKATTIDFDSLLFSNKDRGRGIMISKDAVMEAVKDTSYADIDRNFLSSKYLAGACTPEEAGYLKVALRDGFDSFFVDNEVSADVIRRGVLDMLNSPDYRKYFFDPSLIQRVTDEIMQRLGEHDVVAQRVFYAGDRTLDTGGKTYADILGELTGVGAEDDQLLVAARKALADSGRPVNNDFINDKALLEGLVGTVYPGMGVDGFASHNGLDFSDANSNRADHRAAAIYYLARRINDGRNNVEFATKIATRGKDQSFVNAVKNFIGQPPALVTGTHAGFGVEMAGKSSNWTSEEAVEQEQKELRAQVNAGNIPAGFTRHTVTIFGAEMSVVVNDSFAKKLQEKYGGDQASAIASYIQACVNMRASLLGLTPEQMLQKINENLANNVRGPLIIDYRDRSPNLFGDCMQNGYLYINTQAPEELFVIGVSHELAHEAGFADEEELARQDAHLIEKDEMARAAFMKLSQGQNVDAASRLFAAYQQLAVPRVKVESMGDYYEITVNDASWITGMLGSDEYSKWLSIKDIYETEYAVSGIIYKGFMNRKDIHIILEEAVREADKVIGDLPDKDKLRSKLSSVIRKFIEDAKRGLSVPVDLRGLLLHQASLVNTKYHQELNQGEGTGSAMLFTRGASNIISNFLRSRFVNETLQIEKVRPEGGKFFLGETEIGKISKSGAVTLTIDLEGVINLVERIRASAAPLVSPTVAPQPAPAATDADVVTIDGTVYENSMNRAVKENMDSYKPSVKGSERRCGVVVTQKQIEALAKSLDVSVNSDRLTKQITQEVRKSFDARYNDIVEIFITDGSPDSLAEVNAELGEFLAQENSYVIAFLEENDYERAFGTEGVFKNLPQERLFGVKERMPDDSYVHITGHIVLGMNLIDLLTIYSQPGSEDEAAQLVQRISHLINSLTGDEKPWDLAKLKDLVRGEGWLMLPRVLPVDIEGIKARFKADLALGRAV